MRIPFEFSTPWLALLFAGALKATILLSVAWVATASMRFAPAAARHLVWTLALIGAIGLPLASWLVPAWPLRWVPALTSGGANTAPPASGSLVIHEPAEHHDLSVIDEPVMDEPVASTSGASMIEPSQVAADPEPAVSPTSASPAAQSFPRLDARALLSLLPMVWLFGTVLLLLRRVVAAIRVGRLARRAASLTDPEWRSALARHTASLGISRQPALLISDEADVPMTFGTVRPAVLVPAGALEWASERRDVVLLHELGHIRRRDTLAQLAGQFAAALYWFHPLVWVAKHRQRAEAEHACDDQVLQAGARASAYARELLELATAARPHDTYGAAALAMARRSQLEGRLLTILDPRSARGRVGRRFVAGALLLTIAATAAIAAARPAQKVTPVLAEVPGITAANMPEPRNPRLLAQTPDVQTATPALATDQTTKSDGDATVAGPALALAPDTEPETQDATAAAAANPVVSSMSTSVSTDAGAASEAIAATVSNAVLAASASMSESKSKSSGKSRSSFSIEDNDGDIKVVTGTWIDDDGREAKYKSKGEVRFNDALDDVVSISDGGYLTVELEENGHRWRAEFKPQGGGVQRSYWVDGNRTNGWNDAAREWFGEFLIMTDRRSAMLAKQRYPRLMASGGAKGVLDEIAKMPSDYARSVYYRMLIEDGIDKEDMRRAIAQAGRDVKSDYELSRILQAAAQKGALQDPQTRPVFLSALGGIQSDYEHARVLMLVLERPRLEPAVAAEALASVATIKSDYERSRILVTMSEKGSVSPEIQREYIRTATAIRSDYERARSLKSLVKNSEISAGNVAPLLAATSSIRSDYEKAGVLTEIAESVELDKNARAAFIDTAGQIRSDYERKRALSALGVKSASY